MAAEASKSRDAFQAYLTGSVLDIGAGPDLVVPHAVRWDLEQGDAQSCLGLAPESFDCVWSSHCLEHLRNPEAALARWWALVKPGGFLCLVVPDACGYEQGFWPSRWNPQHISTFSACTDIPWCPAHYNLTDLVAPLPSHRLCRLETVIDEVPSEPRDVTITGARAQVELVLEKVLPYPLASPYAQLFACPLCRHSVQAVGRTPLGDLAVRCERCGTAGTIPWTL